MTFGMLSWLEKSVDEVQESGDSEHFEFLLAAYESLNVVSTSSNEPTPQDPASRVLRLKKDLGMGGRQFIINLILFNYRTADGGRIRQATHNLRTGDLEDEREEYARPFESAPPRYVKALLSCAADPADQKIIADAPPPTVRITPLMDTVYVPPTRFTASFPLVLAPDHPQTLETPLLPGQTYAGEPVRYRFLASFGFAEPAYCWWDKNDRSEYPGTRLSLGAYSLNTGYLRHLRAMLGALQGDTRSAYEKYGSVGRKHVNALLALFGSNPHSGWNTGTQLALGWAVQLLKIARALLDDAAKVEPRKLRAFYSFVQGKLDAHETDLDFIWETRGAYPKITNERNRQFNSHNVFDRIWVIEARLWELAFLSATYLSPHDMQVALRRVFPEWTPSVGAPRETDQSNGVREAIELGRHGVLFDRILFPSGTAAADAVHEHLASLDFATHAVRVSRDDLSTFTPYFEFYQQVTSFLSPEEVARKNTPGKAGGQLWLNLSDGLHDDLLGRPGKDVGLTLARMTAEFVRRVRERASTAPSRLFLVIDYTKFAADMPNDRLYPILAVMARWLRVLVSDEPDDMAGVVFLRSNLKYNTGSLDRYQLGEILVWKQDGELAKPLTSGLCQRAQASFGDPSTDDWSLRGEYLPLAKKVYLLYDAVSHGRWRDYARLWKGAVAPAPLEKPTRSSEVILAMRSKLLVLVEYPLAPIFTHLIADTRRRSLAGSLKGGTKSKISSFWNRLSKDVQGIARRTAFDPALEPGVRKVAGYLEPTLDEIIDALNESLDTIPKSQAPARKELGGYLARLRAARQKLSLKAVLDELDSPGRSRCLVAPTSEAPRARSGDRVGRTSRLVPARRIGGVRRGAPRRRP